MDVQLKEMADVFHDSCHAKSAVDLSFTDHALFSGQGALWAGTMLEGRVARSDRYSPKLHRRAICCNAKILSGYSGTLCMDYSDHLYQCVL